MLFTPANLELRESKNGIANWMIAERIGISETTLVRWFRTEMIESKKLVVLDAIYELRMERGDDKEIPLFTQEVAGMLGLSMDCIYSLVKEKRIPHYRVGTRILFSPYALESWLIDKLEAINGGDKDEEI